MFANQLVRAKAIYRLVFLMLVLVASQPAMAEIGAYIIVDAKTGAVLDSKNANQNWYPASLTKMMTAYLTFKAIREGRLTMNSAVVQSQNSGAEPPSKMGFRVGTRFTVDAALKIIMIKSANDVSVALGEAVAGSEPAFIDMMNAEARRLGMTNTRFTNPHGLPDNAQVSTARDLAILAMALRADFPEAAAIYNQPGIRFGKKTLRSANREFLLRVPGSNGMKTGYICNSGYNVAASVTRKGRTLIAVILGASSGLERTAFARKLFDDNFKKRGRGTVANLKGQSGAAPADGYCRRVKKLSTDDYVAQFDIKKTDGKGNLLAFAGLGKKAVGDHASFKNDNFKLANGKINWAKLLDRTVGPQLIAYNPIRVTLGEPTSPASTIAAEDVPVPLPNPIRLASAGVDVDGVPILRTAENAAEGDADVVEVSPASVAHGSIFAKTRNFPFPAPKPRP